MGYTTSFNGEFKVTPPLTKAQVKYLEQFSETRRMKRDPEKAEALPDPIRKAVKLPLGVDCEFFVGGLGSFGQGHDESVLDHNAPPETQPGLWCQWIPADDGTAIFWNEAEKFYFASAWLQYICTQFLIPWGRKLDGEVTWQGEDPEDIGTIFVQANKVEAIEATITQGRPSWEQSA
jgi:hypothetical protein